MNGKTLYVDLVANVSGFTGKMVGAGATVKQFGNEVTSLDAKSNAAMTSIGKGAGRMALGAGAALGLVAKAAIDWESAWKGVQKTVSGTPEQMDRLEGSLRELARTMPASHEEIAATAEAAGQLGVKTENISDFTKVMIEMGASTNLSADEAATSIAQFMNVMGTAPDKVDELGNTIVALGNKGASTEAEIVHMAQRVSGAGKLVGMTEQDVLGLSAAMANLGIQSELGGGAIQRSFLIINSSVSEGGDKLQALADVAGVSAETFARSWKERPAEAFDQLLHGLGRLKKQGQDIVPVLGGIGIKGTQNLQVLLRLAGSGDMLTKSLKQSNQAWKENTALYREFGLRAQTDASKITVAWNRIVDAAISAGQVVLPVVAQIASAVGTMADAFGALPSGVQTAFVSLLAIATLLGGAVWAGTKIVGGVRSVRSNFAQLRGEETLLARSFQTTGRSATTLVADLKLLATASSRTASASATAAAKQRMTSRLSTGLKAGAAAGGLALMSTGAADSIGLTNTASLALMGTLAGPYGAALGGAIGLTMDLAHANDNLTAATKRANTAAGDWDLKEQEDALAHLSSEMDKTAEHKDKFFEFDITKEDGPLTSLKTAGSLVGDFFTHASDDAEEAKAKIEAANAVSTTSLSALYLAMNPQAGTGPDGSSLVLTADQLMDAAVRATPAMDALGITVEDVNAASERGDGTLQEYVGRIMDWNRHADSAAGRTNAFADEIKGLGDDTLSTAEAAQSLSDALDALLDPSIDAEAATDAWRVSLQNLRNELKDDAGFKGFSKNALANREITRAYVDESKTRLVALANLSSTTEPEMARAVHATREEFIKSGIAAGFSRKQISARADALGLTPKMVRTVFEAAGITKADLAIRAVKEQVLKLPKKVRILLRTDGVPKTKADAIDLAKKLDLTAKQRHALVDLVDHVTDHAKIVNKVLDDLGRKHVSPTVTINNAQAMGALHDVAYGLDRLKPKTIDVVVRHYQQNIDQTGGRRHSAGGGLVSGPGGESDDQVPMMLSNREYVQRAAAVRYYGTGVMSALNSRSIPRELFHGGGRGSGGGGTVVIKQQMGRIDLVLDDGTRLGGYVRGHAHDVAQGVYDDNRDYERTQAGG